MNKIECHPDCKTCIGYSNKHCTSCANLNKVLFGSTCVDFCPAHYYPDHRICYSIFDI